MIRPIRYFGDPILRQASRPVTEFGPALYELAQDMIETMHNADGIGLAAPQIGISQQLFIALETGPVQNDGSEEVDTETLTSMSISRSRRVVTAESAATGRISRKTLLRTSATFFQAEKSARSTQVLTLGKKEKRERWGVTAVHVLANPEITRRSGVQTGQDGCLSVPGLYIDALERDESITLQYQDLTGRQRTLDASGRFAHVLQHEHDHLEGILFFDRLPTAERREFMATHRAELAEIQRNAKAFLRSLRRSVGTASGR